MKTWLHPRTVLLGGIVVNLLNNEVRVEAAQVRVEAAHIRNVDSNRTRKKLWPFTGKDVAPTMDTQCNTRIVADSSSNPDARCPQACPFLARDKTDDQHCTYKCVTADGCAALNPQAPIASQELGICRPPDPGSGCKKAMLDGTDRCEVCDWGYLLQPDGSCLNNFLTELIVLGSVLGLVVVGLVVWIVDLSCRPITNESVLAAGLLSREQMKITGKIEGGEAVEIISPGLDPTAEVGMGESFSRNSRRSTSSSALRHVHTEDQVPLSTDLGKKQVAGPGIVLFFNFQRAIIVWALLMGVGWACLALIVDTTLFTIGTKDFGTPYKNCIVIATGWEAQHRLMWAKVLYLTIAYVSSFVLAIIHSIYQRRRFDDLSATYLTMKDYALSVVGLPKLPGTQNVEADLTWAIQKKLGMEVVGVSIAWNFKHVQGEVIKASIVEEPSAQEYARRSSLPENRPPQYIARQKLHEFEVGLLVSKTEDEDDIEVTDLLSDMKCSSQAFVVFNSEADVALALEQAKGGIEFEGTTVQLENVQCEPTTVQWANFDDSSFSDLVKRCLIGCCWILLALLIWGSCFYAPYAWSVYTFNYDQGKKPGFVYSMTFSMIVVAGNATMYQVCDKVAANIGFRYKDSKEAAYLLLYTTACTLNIMVDFLAVYYISFKINEGLGVHTYDGRLLSDVKMFPEGFETYAVQHTVAENLFLYGFPSTFLIPYICEPLFMTFLPLQIGKFLVRTHKEIDLPLAKALLTPFPMELGRYGDIIVNLTIYIFMLCFPGGYTAPLSLLMVACHLWMYAWDHYRMIRVVPHCTFATEICDWWSQVLLAPLVGLILAILMFKSSVEEGGKQLGSRFCLESCLGAFAAHCVVHWLLLVYFVPLCSSPPKDVTKEVHTYDEYAKEVDYDWFSTNPVHLLRSEYMFPSTSGRMNKKPTPRSFFS